MYNLCVENKRAYRSGVILLWKNEDFSKDAGFAPIIVTAAVSALALLAVLGWQAAGEIKERKNATVYVAQRNQNPGTYPVFSRDRNGSPAGLRDDTLLPQNPPTEQAGLAAAQASLPASTEAKAGPNDFSQMGNDVAAQIAGTYSGLRQMGAYTPEEGERMASNIASLLQAEVSYAPLAQTDLKTDPDTSYERMLAYRSDMQAALRPLLLNSEPEIEIFGRYLESRDKSNLSKLEKIAERYKEAADNMRGVAVPKDAVVHHLAIANSLLGFAATLEQMVKNADDPMATLALLRAYNGAEQDVFISFNSLALYQKQKAS